MYFVNINTLLKQTYNYIYDFALDFCSYNWGYYIRISKLFYCLDIKSFNQIVEKFLIF